MQDLPDINSSSYTTGNIVFGSSETNRRLHGHRQHEAYPGIAKFVENIDDNNNPQILIAKQKGQEMSGRRIVQVFIVDPDEKMPLEESLLYQGDIGLTDLTNEELFFEIEIKNILTEHNKRRVEIEDKKADSKEKKYLEPARIRDLKMTVVDIAVF